MSTLADLRAALKGVRSGAAVVLQIQRDRARTGRSQNRVFLGLQFFDDALSIAGITFDGFRLCLRPFDFPIVERLIAPAVERASRSA